MASQETRIKKRQIRNCHSGVPVQIMVTHKLNSQLSSTYLLPQWLLKKQKSRKGTTETATREFPSDFN